MNKIEIEIPVGKEVDWKASAAQKQIVLRDKQLTYEEVCEKLFKNGYYHAYVSGILSGSNMAMASSPLNASTKHQLECILAKNKLANVARYLNGEWKEYENAHTSVLKYIIWYNLRTGELVIEASHNYTQYTGNIIFKSSNLAAQAIKILGKETVKLALEPLY